MELYGDKIYIQTTEDGGNGSVVISSTGQAYENVFVRESGRRYPLRIQNRYCGVWLADTALYIIVPLHLIDPELETDP